MNIIRIEESLTIPKFRQIYDSIVSAIRYGRLHEGDKLPSINEICVKYNLARETVLKSFNLLKNDGLVESVHGKGFYIASTNTTKDLNIFVFFDTLSSYKEVLYQSIIGSFKGKAVLDIYFHHFNTLVFENILREHLGKYNYYLIMPIDNRKIKSVLQHIPQEKLFFLDRHISVGNQDFSGVYQPFEEDIYNGMKDAQKMFRKYHTLTLIFRNTITEPPEEIIDGFVRYCQSLGIHHVIETEPVTREIRKGEAFLVIDDEDLVQLILLADQKNFKIGKDIGLISYNDTSLKKVIKGGISVISTDFKKMGETIVNLVLKNDKKAIKNPCKFIDRGSF